MRIFVCRYALLSSPTGALRSPASSRSLLSPSICAKCCPIIGCAAVALATTQPDSWAKDIYMRGDLRQSAPDGPLLVGHSSALQEVMRLASLYATEGEPIALSGERGVGKGLVARWIHLLSGRDGAFVTVRGGQLVDTLYQPHLFGVRKGAYTGADRDRKGAFELAQDGTLFADEAERWCRGAQDALLGPMEERTVLPVGGEREIPLTARVIVAAQNPLDQLVHDGVLPADLRDRFGDFAIEIPPLRERRDDILPNAYAFLQARLRQQSTSTPVLFEPAVLERLVSYAWPGNVRQLRNAVTFACVHARADERVRIEHLPPYLRELAPCRRADTLRIRQHLVDWALQMSDGDRRAAARLVQMHPNSIDNYRKRAPQH